MTRAHRLGFLVVASLASACAPRATAPRPPVLGPPQLVAASAPTMPKLVEAVAGAERAGAGKAARVAEGILFEGERMGAYVDVPEDECMLVLARGSSTVTDLDLVVWSDEGEWLAGDERRDADPSVILCPPHPTRVHPMGLVAAGRGAVSLTAQRVPRAAEGSVRAWLSTLRPPSERGDDRARRVLVHANPDVPVLVPLDLEADGCAEVRATGSGATADPDLTLLDEAGAVRRRASNEGGDAAVLRLCVGEPFHGQIAVRARLGQSDVVVGSYKASLAQWQGEGRRVDLLARSGELALPASITFARDTAPIAVARLLERGLEVLGEGVSEVHVVRGVGGVPLTVGHLAGAGGGASVAVVRTERSRFSARATTADGAVRYQVTGVGEARFATPALAQELVIELAGLAEDEPFVVLVAR